MENETGFKRVFIKLEKAYLAFSNVLACISGGCLIIIMLLAFFDVISAKLFNVGISGQYEIIQMLSIPLLYLTLSYTHLTRDQIKIMLILDKMPKIIIEIVIYFGYCLGAFMGFFMAWHSFRNVLRLKEMSSVTSGNVGILQWPVCLILVLGCVFLGIAYIFTIIRRALKIDSYADGVPADAEPQNPADTAQQGGE